MENKNHFSKLSFGELYSNSFSLTTAKFGQFFILAFIFFIINWGLNTIMSNVFSPTMNSDLSILFIQIIFLIFIGIISLIGQGAFIHFMAGVSINANTNIMKSIRHSVGMSGKWFGYIGFFILAILGLSFAFGIIGFIFIQVLVQFGGRGFAELAQFGVILIAIMLFIGFIFIIPIISTMLPMMVLENINILKAISRVRTIFKEVGYGKSLGIFLVMLLIYIAIVVVLGFIGGWFSYVGFNTDSLNSLPSMYMSMNSGFTILTAFLGVLGIIFTIVFNSLAISVLKSATIEADDIEEEHYKQNLRDNLGYYEDDSGENLNG